MLSDGVFFITGTNTDCGKTHVSQQLLLDANQENKRTMGLKPVASGGNDAQLLKKVSSVQLSDDEVNPFYFKTPVSAHIAAALENKSLSVHQIVKAVHDTLLRADFDLAIIEGAGGVYHPINQQETFIDLMKALDISVIMVVGMQLGCLSLAQMTLETLNQHKIPVEGWIATQVDPNMLCYEENLEALQQRLQAPCLKVLSHKALCQNMSVQQYEEACLE